jgi:MFS family permease
VAVVNRIRGAFRHLPTVYWWLWLGVVINAIGAFTLPFLAYFLSRRMNLAPAQIGLIIAGFGAGSLIAALAAGWISDHLGRRHTLLAAQLLTAAATTAFAVVRSALPFAACVFVFGVAINIPNPVLRALIADVVPPHDRGRAYALSGWATGLGAAVAPILGGLIAAHAGFTWLFLGDTATTAAYALITYARVGETSPTPSRGRRSRRLVLLTDRALLIVVALNTCFAIVYFQGQATLPIVMADHGLQASTYGLALATGIVVTLILQIPVALLVERLPRRIVIAAGCAVTGLGFGLTAFASTPLAYAATVAVWSLGALAVTPFTSALVADLAPDDARGRYQGAYQLSWSSSRLVAPPLGGLTLQHAEQGVLWSGCAALAWIAAASHLITYRNSRRQ